MMDQSYSESDVSISPSQILDRLQVLRQLQILQRGKLQKHRLQYESSPEITSSITEIVSQFSNSTSYNTFRSLLQSSQETNEVSHSNITPLFRKENLQNVIEGVSVLNLSEESEFIANSVSSRNSSSPRLDSEKSHNIVERNLSKKQISLDEMPILSPKKDFETLITEKLKNEKKIIKEVPTDLNQKKSTKKPFLRKGEGMGRFGIQKNDLVIQNTKSLPWKRKKSGNKTVSKVVNKKSKNKLPGNDNIKIQILDKDTTGLKEDSHHDSFKKTNSKVDSVLSPKEIIRETEQNDQTSSTSTNHLSSKNIETLAISKLKQPLHASRGQTWASVFTKEQDDFLRQLKQSEYYKNFVSPAKSTLSDISSNENLSRLKQDREIAEQNLFELIENKVTHESFSIDNSFFNRFLKKSSMDCSGESTPLVMQKCLNKNPNLMHILPDVASRKRNDNSSSDLETCNSECTDCSENCSVSSCCSCQTITEANISVSCIKEDKINEKGDTIKMQRTKPNRQINEEKEISHNDTLTAENEAMNSNMAEMNAKLIATSELLKDRLKELEDEIDTFRKENANLTRMREEVDIERQKLFEEKNTFEQKFNEEKILSEYYLAEEKEKLNKQKQTYERYVREMRGRLNKKEKDEVINLKKEIQDLKDEIRIKDAKSTSTIARLRNQIKIIEKDKKNLEDEVEKLKKENKRIQHSNDITRRLTNLKYLEQINKKLSTMTSKDSIPDVQLDSNIKYKAFEIERQSRSRNRKSYPNNAKGMMKMRAKSVPNLHVTSRYAKYFSQKDSLSDKNKNMELSDNIDCNNIDNDHSNSKNNSNDFEISNSNSDTDEDNNLEKLYNDRFKSTSLEGRSSNGSAHFELSDRLSCNSDYFIEKSNKSSSLKSVDKCFSTNSQQINHSHSRTSKSPSMPYNRSHQSTSPTNYFSENFNYNSDNHIDANHRSKSPVSILSNHSSSSLRSGTVIINKEVYSDRIIPSPEPMSSKTTLSKTNLNPTEIRKPDGTRELRFPNGNVKIMSADGKYSKFLYYNGDIKENFYNEGRIKYYYAETKTFHTTHPDGLEILEFPDGQVEKRYKDGSSEIKLPNGSIRYYDPKNEHVREEWRFPDGASLTVSATGEQRIVFANGQVEVHAKDHKRREFPDGSVKLVYNDGTAETRYASGRIRIKDKHGNLIMDSAPG
ncbi:centromere protein J [Vanessa atalanta]|uniref:centromere protein J n=1 Tax=Vanessa atalanta TaxID=42275 RepID=UPI001FCD0566|nr:centromere protein J [Vanessa atalanta]